MQLTDKSWDWGLGEVENHIYLHIFCASLQSYITRLLGTGAYSGLVPLPGSIKVQGCDLIPWDILLLIYFDL